MATIGERQREKLFLLYAQNLLLYWPDATDQFICPICRRIFDRIALNKRDPEVILAHVIPKKIDGKLVTLSCRACDNRIGTIYDAHVAKEKRHHEFEMGFQMCSPESISHLL
jgi:hypothetical protein